MITIKALLLKRFKAYPIAGKTKHVIKATVKGHSLIALLACPKIFYKLVGACYINKYIYIYIYIYLFIYLA
jgi:hypothetical protein